MKKFIGLLLLAAAFGNAASAQTKDVKRDKVVLKKTIEDKKEDKHEAGKDLAHLKVKHAIKKRKEVRRHRRSIHKQAKHLKKHGVARPRIEAQHEAKVDKDKKNKKD
ncbi:MAG: hypothetical protein ABJA78_15745 [Ferruginibacter sp.]